MLLAGHGRREVVEVRGRGLQVAQEHLGHVVAEAVAHHDPEDGQVLAVGGHRVRRHQPAPLTKLARDVVDVVLRGGAADRERHHGQVPAVRDDVELRHLAQGVGDVHGHVLAGLLDRAVALLAEAEELEVLQDDLGAGPREVQRERGHVTPEVVHVEDQVVRQERRPAPQHPADARIDETELVARRLDGDHPLQAEVPHQVRLQEGGDEAARGGVDVHRHGDAGPRLVVVEGRADLLHRLVAAVHRRADDGHHADRVLVHVVEQPVGGQVEDVALEAHVARLDVPVVGELLPDDLDVPAHHDVGAVGGLAGLASGVLPAPLEREPAEHAPLGAARRRGAHALRGVRGVPQVPEHPDAPFLDLGGLRVLVLVDHVLVERGGVEAVRLVVHPGGDERGQVEPGVPVEHDLVQDDLVRRLGQHLPVRDPVSRHRHHARPGEPGSDALVLLLRRPTALPHAHGSSSRCRWVHRGDHRSLAGEHRGCLALQVHERLAADVDRHPVEVPAGEGPRTVAGVVVGDGLAAVPPDAEALARDGELARLGADPPLADLLVAVPQRQGAVGHAGRVLGVLLEAGREHQVGPGREVLGGHDPLLDHARGSCRRSAAGCPGGTARGRRSGCRARTARPARPGPGRSTRAPMLNDRLRMLAATDSGTSAPPGR